MQASSSYPTDLYGYFWGFFRICPLFPDRVIPGIKLSGYWLQRAGFEVNEKIRIRIRVMQGCLVITAE
ncbi:hypothetical protein BVH03_17280 [Pseudomonas sp. PA15(2017)]|nr:SymE family type I addiction module toxin [Pseudomonas sp. PA15(2017)]OLU25898.1 hypothetical protein BVH03_17280 [Pseudomonas sp. PA15(2017)]